MKQILSQESVTISLGDHDGRGPKEFGNLYHRNYKDSQTKHLLLFLIVIYY